VSCLLRRHLAIENGAAGARESQKVSARGLGADGRSDAAARAVRLRELHDI